MQRLGEHGNRAQEQAVESTTELATAHYEDVWNSITSEHDQQFFTPGQQVIWIYNTSHHHRYRIAAEIVQMGQLRARIRSLGAEGKPILRWVKPSNLRQREAGELSDPYPSCNE